MLTGLNQPNGLQGVGIQVLDSIPNPDFAQVPALFGARTSSVSPRKLASRPAWTARQGHQQRDGEGIGVVEAGDQFQSVHARTVQPVAHQRDVGVGPAARQRAWTVVNSWNKEDWAR